MGTDSTMGEKGRLSASEAVDHLRKHFRCDAKGSAYGNKHGDVVANSVKAILGKIRKLHDQKKKYLESIYIRVTIHDSATKIDYGNILPIMKKITNGLRENIPKSCSLHWANAGHINTSNEIKFEYEGFFIERVWGK